MAAPKFAKVEIRPLLLNYGDAAAALGMATQTLRNGISTGRFPGLKPVYLGNRPLFRLTDLEKFAASLPTEPIPGENGATEGKPGRSRK
ncbi:MAG: hypothetical protein WAW37_14195 [Syntrophobacteraceae bacterium]